MTLRDLLELADGNLDAELGEWLRPGSKNPEWRSLDFMSSTTDRLELF